MIPKSSCIKNIFSVNSGFFDTRLKILTPAPLVVLVTNIRHAAALAVVVIFEMRLTSVAVGLFVQEL